MSRSARLGGGAISDEATVAGGEGRQRTAFRDAGIVGLDGQYRLVDDNAVLHRRRGLPVAVAGLISFDHDGTRTANGQSAAADRAWTEMIEYDTGNPDEAVAVNVIGATP